MRFFLAIFAAVVCLAQLASDDVQKLLPPGAKIIESADITSVAKKPRMLVLWMMRPALLTTPEDAIYCGTYVHGKKTWQGPARLSLIDPLASVVINTVRILDAGYNGHAEDRLELPAFVANDYYYVPRPNSIKEGKPLILNLRDFTGEGAAAQFALFIYGACSIVSSSAFGYSVRDDRTMKYQTEVIENGHRPTIEEWPEQVFARKPVRPGYWNFKWRPAHGSDDEIHEVVTFDRIRQRFVDHRTVKPIPNQR